MDWLELDRLERQRLERPRLVLHRLALHRSPRGRRRPPLRVLPATGPRQARPRRSALRCRVEHAVTGDAAALPRPRARKKRGPSGSPDDPPRDPCATAPSPGAARREAH
jgi:hypothetical protein